jgi:hypothetical protein
MLAWLRGLRATQPQGDEQAQRTPAFPAGEMTWRREATLPIPDWDAQSWPATADADVLSAHANGMAAAWLDALMTALPDGYQRSESANFMLLSPLEARPTRVLLDYLERSRKRVLATLPGITDDLGHGAYVVLVFHDEDSYYRYIANYGGSSPDPEAFTSGMFIDAGYGHFTFMAGPFDTMEPVVVHELTHCLVRHLPIPAWLNEGLAVNTEQRFVPARPRWGPSEREFLFSRFWTPETIQEFWSGKSFLRPDEGQSLSYELAKLLVQLLDKDYERLQAFCRSAVREDGGMAAAGPALGASLAELAGAVLGEGDWTPRPEMWTTGTEKGQFSRPPRPAPGTARR